MSLVGTRPPTVDEWEQYELHHRSRMSTKPGMDKCGYSFVIMVKGMEDALCKNYWTPWSPNCWRRH